MRSNDKGELDTLSVVLSPLQKRQLLGESVQTHATFQTFNTPMNHRSAKTELEDLANLKEQQRLEMAQRGKQLNLQDHPGYRLHQFVRRHYFETKVICCVITAGLLGGVIYMFATFYGPSPSAASSSEPFNVFTIGDAEALCAELENDSVMFSVCLDGELFFTCETSPGTVTTFSDQCNVQDPTTMCQCEVGLVVDGTEPDFSNICVANAADAMCGALLL